MIKKSVLLNKFQAVDKCLERIEDKLSGDINRLNDQDIQEIFILNLQRAVQSTIDSAAHIVREKKLPLPNRLRDYFSLLASNGIISEELSQKLERMVGFRNIAVHDYEVLDVKILQSIYRENLEDLKIFQNEVCDKLFSSS